MATNTPTKKPSESYSRRKLLVAILVIAAILFGMSLLLAIPALFALGVFNPTVYTTSSATGFGELGKPADWSYSGTKLTILFSNQAEQDITITSVESPTCTIYSSQQTIQAGGTREVSLMGCPEKSPGTIYSQTVTVVYSKSSGLEHSVTGTLRGTAI
jgi:hypothetical protein